MGCGDLRSIRLTARERATLASAARILEELRGRRESDDDALGVDVALAAYTVREVLEGETVPV